MNGNVQAPSCREEQLLRLIENASDTLVELDLGGIINCISGGVESLAGMPFDELIGADLMSLVHPDDHVRLRQAWRDLRFRSDQVTATYRTLHRDGRQIWTEAIFRRLPQAGPATPRDAILGVLRDITWRVAGEQAAGFDKLSELLLENVVDYAIFFLDLDGNVRTWNAGAQRINGYHAQEIIGTNFAVFYTDDDVLAGEPARSLAAARANGKFETEGWRVRKDGSLLWANVVIDTVRDAAGTLIGFAKVTRDVTHRLAERAALEKVTEELRRERELTSLAAMRDPLTGLFNRAGLETWVASKPELVGSVLFIDIDGFKAVNERSTRAVGDEALRRFSQILNRSVRDEDLTARVGGDEFVIMLRGATDREVTNDVIERINKAIAAFFPLGAAEGTRVGVSIGMSFYTGDRALAEAISEADADRCRKKLIPKPNAASVVNFLDRRTRAPNAANVIPLTRD